MGTSPSPGWPHLQKTGLERRQRQRRPEQGGVRAGGGQARTESHETSLPSPGRGQKSQIPKMTERPGAGPHPAAPSPGGTRLRCPGRTARLHAPSRRCRTDVLPLLPTPQTGEYQAHPLAPPGTSSARRASVPGHWAGVEDVTTAERTSLHAGEAPPSSRPPTRATWQPSHSRRTQSHSGLLKCECAGSQVLCHKQSAFYSDVPEVGVTPSSTEH